MLKRQSSRGLDGRSQLSDSRRPGDRRAAAAAAGAPSSVDTAGIDDRRG